MTTDDLYIESFRVGYEYNNLLNKVVSDVIDVIREHADDDSRIDACTLRKLVDDEVDGWLSSCWYYPMYVILHFGVYNVIEGCDYEDSPSEEFARDVQNIVEGMLDDMGIELIG